MGCKYYEELKPKEINKETIEYKIYSNLAIFFKFNGTISNYNEKLGRKEYDYIFHIDEDNEEYEVTFYEDDKEIVFDIFTWTNLHIKPDCYYEKDHDDQFIGDIRSLTLDEFLKMYEEWDINKLLNLRQILAEN
jgi:hypothetical protein